MPRTIVITGASDGIGAAAARQLHEDGNRVVIVGRSPQKTQAVAREIGADHYLADFTELDEVRKLVASRASVIQTSSSGARLFGKLAIDDLDHDKDFSAQLAYGTVKLENILFTTELRRRFHSQGISTAAFHPGAVRTSFATESVPGTDWVSGTYYEKHRPARRSNPQALDVDLAKQLWDRSEQLLAQKIR